MIPAKARRSYAAVAARVPLTPGKHCSISDAGKLVVPRAIHEASEFLMALHGVKPGTLPLSELLRLRPELANLKWNDRTREISSFGELNWLLCDWEFKRGSWDLRPDEVNDLRKQFSDSYEAYYSVEVVKRVFEILDAILTRRGSLSSYFFAPCDTANHIIIAMELAEFLILPERLRSDLLTTWSRCAEGKVWMEMRQQRIDAFWAGEYD